jgi:hypothetical protein
LPADTGHRRPSQYLEHIAVPTAEHEYMAAVLIFGQRSLDLGGKTAHPGTNVGDASGKPDPPTGGKANHVCRLWSTSCGNVESVLALTRTTASAKTIWRAGATELGSVDCTILCCTIAGRSRADCDPGSVNRPARRPRRHLNNIIVLIS